MLADLRTDARQQWCTETTRGNRPAHSVTQMAQLQTKVENALNANGNALDLLLNTDLIVATLRM